MQDDATGKSWPRQFFPSETTLGYLCLLRQLLRRFGVPLAFYGRSQRIFSATMTTGQWKNSWPENASPPQFGRALEQLSVTFIAANSPQAKVASSACGAY